MGAVDRHDRERHGKAKRRRSKIDSKPDCDGKSPWLDHLQDANQGALPEIRLCVFVNPV